ncbi:hypothetical protein ACFX2K_017128 [Malus domestica]
MHEEQTPPSTYRAINFSALIESSSNRRWQKIDLYRSLSSVPQNTAKSSKEGLEGSKQSTVRVVEFLIRWTSLLTKI